MDKLRNLFRNKDELELIQTLEQKTSEEIILEPVSSLYTDLDFLETFNTILDKTCTKCGRKELWQLFMNVTNNVKLLKKRQNNIRQLRKFIVPIRERLYKLAKYESELFWNNDKSNELLNSQIYFKWFGFLNNNQLVMDSICLYKTYIMPTMSIGIPTITIAMPLIFMLFKGVSFDQRTMIFMYKILFQMMANTSVVQMFSKLGIGAIGTLVIGVILTLMLYAQNIYLTIMSAINMRRIIELIRGRVECIGKFIQGIEQIAQTLGRILPFNNKFRIDYNGSSGKILVEYNRILGNIHKLDEYKKYLGVVDALISCAELTRNNGYCFTQFSNGFKIWNGFHPILGNKCVKNNINIKNNILLTGANASGKSTFIKTLMYAVILSQTIGIAPAKRFKLGIFDDLRTYIRIPDSVGYESQFQAEINRNMEYIRLLENGKRTFVIIDEIFTSTNGHEGVAAAYGVLKKISRFPNNLAIVTTHYHNLCDQLPEYDKYCFNSKIDNDKVSYSHKLKRGISKDCVALRILKNVDKDIVNDAMRFISKK